MAKSYKVMTDIEATNYIEKKGLRNMTIFELRSVGRPLMTKVRQRMKELRAENLQHTPAYQAYKKLGMKTSTSAKKRQTLLTEVFNAYNFLMAQTSTVYGAEKYMSNVEHLFGRKLTPKEAKKMFAVMDSLKSKNENLYEAFSSSQIANEVGWQAFRGSLSADEIADVVVESLTSAEAKMEYEATDPFADRDRDFDPTADDYWVGL